MTHEPNLQAVTQAMITGLLENVGTVRDVLNELADVNYCVDLERFIADAAGLVHHIESNARLLQQLVALTLNHKEDSMSNQPTHHVYYVKDLKDKSHWTKIGAAWPNKDGKGFNIELELMPVSSGGPLKLTLREASEKEQPGQEQQAA